MRSCGADWIEAAHLLLETGVRAFVRRRQALNERSCHQERSEGATRGPPDQVCRGSRPDSSHVFTSSPAGSQCTAKDAGGTSYEGGVNATKAPFSLVLALGASWRRRTRIERTPVILKARSARVVCIISHSLVPTTLVHGRSERGLTCHSRNALYKNRHASPPTDFGLPPTIVSQVQYQSGLQLDPRVQYSHSSFPTLTRHGVHTAAFSQFTCRGRGPGSGPLPKVSPPRSDERPSGS